MASDRKKIVTLFLKSQVFSNLDDLGQELQSMWQTPRLSRGKCQQGRKGAGMERHKAEKRHLSNLRPLSCVLLIHLKSFLLKILLYNKQCTRS